MNEQDLMRQIINVTKQMRAAQKEFYRVRKVNPYDIKGTKTEAMNKAIRIERELDALLEKYDGARLTLFD